MQIRPEFSGNTIAARVSEPVLPLMHSYRVVPDGVTEGLVAIWAADICPRDGATAPPAEPTLFGAGSLGGIAGIADCVGGAGRGIVCTGDGVGTAVTGFGCSIAGSSTGTVGTCWQEASNMAVKQNKTEQ